MIKIEKKNGFKKDWGRYDTTTKTSPPLPSSRQPNWKTIVEIMYFGNMSPTPPPTKLVLLWLIYPSQSIYGGGVRVKTQSSCPFWKIPKEAATFVYVNKYYNLFSLLNLNKTVCSSFLKTWTNPLPIKEPPPPKKKQGAPPQKKGTQFPQKHLHSPFYQRKNPNHPHKANLIYINKKQKEKNHSVSKNKRNQKIKRKIKRKTCTSIKALF